MTRAHALRCLNLAHFLDHFFLLVFPTAVIALHREWGIGYGEALALGTPSFVAFALGTLPAGWLGDRLGGVLMMRAFFVGIGLASIAVGLAQDPLALAVALGALGLFAAIYHPVAIAMVVGLSERSGRALGVNGVYGNLGVAAAPLATGALAQAFGWRAAFVVPGALTVALGMVYLAWSREHPDALDAGSAEPRAAMAPGDPLRVLLVVAVTSLFGGLIFHGVTVALPKLLEERLALEGTGLLGIGAAASLIFALAAFTQIPAGRLVDRSGAKPVLLLASGLQIPLLLAVGLFPGGLAALAALPLMVAVFGQVPVVSWLVGRHVPPAWRARAYGLQFLLSLGVSAVILPLIAALHAKTGTSGALFALLAGVGLLVFTAAFALPGRRASAPLPAS